MADARTAASRGYCDRDRGQCGHARARRHPDRRDHRARVVPLPRDSLIRPVRGHKRAFGVCRLPARARGRPADPGIAFPLVRAAGLERDRPGAGAARRGHPRCRAPSDTGLRIFNSIQHFGPTSAAPPFTSGALVALHQLAVGTQRCSCGEPGIGGGRWKRGSPPPSRRPRPANRSTTTAHCIRRRRGDLRRRERTRLARTRGEAFGRHERERACEPFVRRAVPRLPVRPRRSPGRVPGRRRRAIRTALVDRALRAGARTRIRTLREWEVRLTRALFLGGRDKGPFLEAFGADIFFDDLPHNIDLALPCRRRTHRTASLTIELLPSRRVSGWDAPAACRFCTCGAASAALIGAPDAGQLPGHPAAVEFEHDGFALPFCTVAVNKDSDS